MTFLERYGASPLTSTVLKRGLDEVLGYGQGTAQPLDFVKPTAPHPIAKLFTRDARYNASGIVYRRAIPYDLPSNGVYGISFSSHVAHRPPNPDYFFADELPYPVGVVDRDGAGMTYGWTPLGYLLYHDRISFRESTYWRIINGSYTDTIIEREIWARMMRHGRMFAHDSSGLRYLLKMIISTDPPADLIPLLMWDHDYCRRETNSVNEVIAACEDFQMNWNCGAWFDPSTRSGTQKTLKLLFDL